MLMVSTMRIVTLLVIISFLDVEILGVGYKRKRDKNSDKCPGFNEMYTRCNAECDTFCLDLIDSKQRTKCIPAKCTEGCICKRGTGRRQDGTCVRMNSCMKELFEIDEDFAASDMDEYTVSSGHDDEDFAASDRVNEGLVEGQLMFAKCSSKDPRDCKKNKKFKDYSWSGEDTNTDISNQLKYKTDYKHPSVFQDEDSSDKKTSLVAVKWPIRFKELVNSGTNHGNQGYQRPRMKLQEFQSLDIKKEGDHNYNQRSLQLVLQRRPKS